MINLADWQHPPEVCRGSATHCHVHNVDEQIPPGTEAYHICLECNHAFLTGDDLLSAHNQMLKLLDQHAERFGHSAINAPPETDPEMVWCCPFCTHNF